MAAEGHEAVSAGHVRELRERTGAGVMDCKKALLQAGGRTEEALKILRSQGAQLAAEKAGRSACQGLIGSYVHNGRIGVLVEVRCETDFVTRTDPFKDLVRDLCLQIASMQPRFVRREEVPPEEIGAEPEQARREQFYREHVLLAQAFVKDPSKTVQDRLHETVSATRENIVIQRFVRMELGEEAGSSPAPRPAPR